MEQLRRISRESGVNIITGTSYYIDSTVPEEAKLLSVQEVHVYTCIQCMYMYSKTHVHVHVCQMYTAPEEAKLMTT